MNKEFWDLYNRELRILYEQSKDYAASHPGVAERLGGLTEDRMDPGLKGLLEGSAFLAARVQLKIKSEFSEFSTSLLDHLLPNYLAPVTSSALVKANPNFEDTNLLAGKSYAQGSYLDAVYVERERRVACRFRLGSDLVLWPLRIEQAQYYTGPAGLQAIGLEVLPGTVGGLRLRLHNRSTAPEKDVPGVTPPGHPMSKLPIDELPIHLVGNAGDADEVFEQLFANLKRITLRYEDSHGDPMFMPMTLDQVQQIGFEESDHLAPFDQRAFLGFETLREYFIFPQKFTGFRLTKLRPLMQRLSATNVDILFEFDTVRPQLASVVNPAMFCLYAAPATNLFEMQCSRVPINPREYEHQIVPDRSKWLDFEAHRIIDVYAHYPGRRDKVKVYPLYSLPTTDIRIEDALYYTVRRLPRVPTAKERRYGSQSNYAGTELFISLYEPAELDDEARVKELSVRAICSNRHLAEQLPVGETGADFSLSEDTQVQLVCLHGPTAPRDSVVHSERKQREANHPGPVMWRLINLLALNHLGLTDRNDEDRAGGLRELLGLFANLSDVFSERQVRGVDSVQSRPVVRRIRQANGFNAARGIEITITFDESAFEGTGVMVLGAALDRFLSEYTSINSFTQTVIATTQRGVIVRWPPRSGLGGTL